MTREAENANPDWPEILAAYLAGNTPPEVRSLLDPPEPDEATWDRVYEGIERRLESPLLPPPRRGGRFGLILAVAAGLAAAVAFVSALPRPPAPVGDAPVALVRSEPLTWATGGDVEIISVAEEDAPLLLVGAHPLADPMTWAVGTDFALEWVEPGPDGQALDMGTAPGSDGPMFVDFTRLGSAP